MIRCGVTDCPNLIMGPGATGGSTTLSMCWDCIDRSEALDSKEAENEGC